MQRSANTNSYTLCVLGAGTTGAAAALFAAEAGLRVVVLERRPIESAGARWVNDVPVWMFERAGLPDVPGALSRDDHTAHLFARPDRPPVSVPTRALAAIDMRALGRSLIERALVAGAELRGGASVERVDGSRVHLAGGEVVTADFIVDATGLGGTNLLGRPRPLRTDLCAAAQEMRSVKNLDQARAFFAARGADPHDAVITLCPAGGFSVLNVKLIGDELFVLSGTIPALGFVPGGRVTSQWIAEQAWVGEALYGGERAIPLSAPVVPFAHGRHAHVGDSAEQVFAAHGSGTGSGLIAARLLVDALVEQQDLHAYQARWYREYGTTHFVYDLLRRASMTIAPGESEALFANGFLDATGLDASMQQRLPPASVTALVRRLAKLPSLGAFGLRVAGFLMFVPPLAALAENYPDDPLRARFTHHALQAIYRRVEARTAALAYRKR